MTPIARMVLALALAAAFVAPAQAQTAAPTAANAQLFLKTVIGQGGTSFSFDDFLWYRTPPPNRSYDGCQSDCPYNGGATASALQASSSEACATTVTVTVAGYNAPTDYGNAYFRSSMTNYPYAIDWRKVAKVRVVESEVYISGYAYGGVRLTRVSFSATELATRAAKAMEFLRAQCDPTAATGF